MPRQRPEPNVPLVTRTPRTAVVAVGGNALLDGGASATIAEQFEHAQRFATQLRQVVGTGWRIVLTHGNGPQVGFIKRRSDLVSELEPGLPQLGLDMCVADSQGSIGYILAASIQSELRASGLSEQVVALITHTVVREDDPAFSLPTKPIGSFYDQETAQRLAEENGWTIVEDSGRGWRRLVASPRPQRIVEQDAISALVDAGFLVVAAGGGGIPVIEQSDGRYQGVEAVIDKDFASALLAAELDADLLCITTGVERIAINFGTPNQRELDTLGLDEARAHLADGQFPPGSMGPKVQAALSFVEETGGEVLITHPDRLADAMAGRAGTRFVATAPIA